jgi:hypothetical protein
MIGMRISFVHAIYLQSFVHVCVWVLHPSFLVPFSCVHPPRPPPPVSLHSIHTRYREHFMEYFKVQLSVPGGGPIMGKDYQAVVRTTTTTSRGR